MAFTGLGNQVGSTIGHLQLLPTQHTKRSKYVECRADRVEETSELNNLPLSLKLMEPNRQLKA